MAHQAYEPGTQCYFKILEKFGQDLKNENGNIDRKKLGGKVFSSPECLHQLESIVWPEILKLALEKTEDLHQQGKKIVIWDAAVLLAAEWDKHVHEVIAYFLHFDEKTLTLFFRFGEPLLTDKKLSKELLKEMIELKNKL